MSRGCAVSLITGMVVFGDLCSFSAVGLVGRRNMVFFVISGPKGSWLLWPQLCVSYELGSCGLIVIYIQKHEMEKNRKVIGSVEFLPQHSSCLSSFLLPESCFKTLAIVATKVDLKVCMYVPHHCFLPQSNCTWRPRMAGRTNPSRAVAPPAPLCLSQGYIILPLTKQEVKTSLKTMMNFVNEKQI